MREYFLKEKREIIEQIHLMSQTYGKNMIQKGPMINNYRQLNINYDFR